MEEELLKVQKLESLGVLAGGIAHDFNNILTAIMGNIAILEKSVGGNENICKRLDELSKATLEARSLNKQLLSFSKGGAPLTKADSVKELLHETIDFSLRGSNVVCNISSPDNL